MVSLEFSSVQLGQLFWLLLGLEFTPPNTDNGLCFCGRANDASGYHCLNCPQNPGKSRAQGHNLVVSAVGFENRRLGLLVVDIDAAMHKPCTHPTHWHVAMFLFVLLTWKIRIVQRDMAMLGSSLWLMSMVIGANDGMQEQANTTIWECWLLPSKPNIGSMN